MNGLVVLVVALVVVVVVATGMHLKERKRRKYITRRVKR